MFINYYVHFTCNVLVDNTQIFKKAELFFIRRCSKNWFVI